MNAIILPGWLRFSEKAFSVTFIAFSFVMFACWFPTGFSATFSTLAFIFALPTFFNRMDWVNLSRFEQAGLLLFFWLLLSVFWSEGSFVESLGFLSEYRLYFMLPVMISILSINPAVRYWSLGAAMAGAFIALVTSYGLGFGWWHVDGANYSLANRIYHGFIMSLFLLACLLVARECRGIRRVAGSVLACLIVYNVLNIEIGRTGYLLIIAVWLVFCFLTFTFKKLILVYIFSFVTIGFSYLLLDRFQNRVDQTLNNAVQMFEFDKYDWQSSAGTRIEFYRAGLGVIYESPLIGVGVGDVADFLNKKWQEGELRSYTDNIHSEFLNMLMAGGLPALFLFSGFIVSIAWTGFIIRPLSRIESDALVCIAVILLISAVFNSTIKDYGEKHVLLILLSILGSSKLRGDNLQRSGVNRCRGQ